MKHIAIIAACLLVLAGCKNNNTTPADPIALTDYAAIVIPEFDTDSVYLFVKTQTDMGFRTPGSKAHNACADYIAKTMRRWCDTVIVQPFTTTLWNGQKVDGIHYP